MGNGKSRAGVARSLGRRPFPDPGRGAWPWAACLALGGVLGPGRRDAAVGRVIGFAQAPTGLCIPAQGKALG